MVDIKGTLFHRAIDKYFPHNGLKLEACQKDYIICIPQCWSINFTIKVKDINNHVLKKMVGEHQYQTKTGINVVFSDGLIKVMTKPIKTVHVIQIIPDTFINEADNSEHKINILYINTPFVGGIDAPVSLGLTPISYFLKYASFLYSFPENISLFSSIELFINKSIEEMKNINFQMTSFITALNDDMDTKIYYCIQSVSRSNNSGNNKAVYNCIEFTVKSFYHFKLHDSILNYLASNSQVNIVKFLDQLKIHREHNGQHLHGFSREHMLSLKDKLIQVFTSKTPLCKLQMLQEVYTLLSSFFIAIHNKFPEEDDKLDITILLLVMFPSDLHQILVDLDYIETFSYQSLDLSTLGFIFHTYKAAVNYILTKEPESKNRRELNNSSRSISMTDSIKAGRDFRQGWEGSIAYKS